MIIPQSLAFTWNKLGSVDSKKLNFTRDEMHNAAQLVALVGYYLLPERDDDSHTSMQWYPELQALVSEAIGNKQKFRVGLRLRDHTLMILTATGEVIRASSLVGKTKIEAFHWLEDQINKFGDYSSQLGLEMHYSIPGHPIQDGQVFRIDHQGEFEEMALYFSNAHNVLQALKDAIPEAGPVRCWPHHFDIATLIILDKDKPAEETRSLGIGLSPGDMSYYQPYFYVSPWPYPNIEEIDVPLLKGNGKWHTEGWVGCLLLAERIERVKDEKEQKQMVNDFILSALKACYDILESRESLYE
jgi:hypothetical protein